ncbi:transposase [Vibrio mimicus]
MSSTTKRAQRDYSLAFKLAIVDQVEKGELTDKQAQERYGIQGHSTVLVWLRQHGRLDWRQGTTQITLGGLMSIPSQPTHPSNALNS